MATSAAPPRELAPLVKRADEIQSHHPRMAYYCECIVARAALSPLGPKPSQRTVGREMDGTLVTPRPSLLSSASGGCEGITDTTHTFRV